MSFAEDFADLIEPIVIGRFDEGTDVNEDPTETWITVYLTKGHFQTIRGRTHRLAEADRIKTSHMIFVESVVEIDGDMRIYRTGDFVWERDKKMDYYSPIASDVLDGYVRWIAAEKVSQ